MLKLLNVVKHYLSIQQKKYSITAKTMQTFAEKITLLMNAKGLTQAELSRKIGVGQTTVSLWQRGAATPTPRTMQKVSDYFQIPPEVLKDNTKILSVTDDKNAINANLEIQNLTHSLEKIITLRNDLNATIEDIVSLLNRQIQQIKKF